MIRAYVSRQNLNKFDPYWIRRAWDNRWKNRLHWWGARLYYGLKLKRTDAPIEFKGITVFLTQDEYDKWRARHGRKG